METMSAIRPDLLDLLDAATGERAAAHADLRPNVLALAVALKRRGVVEGDRVVALMGNRFEVVELYLACVRLGAIWVGVNPNAPQVERNRQIALVAPRLVVVDRVSEGIVPATTVFAAELAAERDQLDDSDRPELDMACAIAFTSGTTALPKTVVHSRAAVSLAAAALARNRIYAHDRVGVVLPLAIHNVVIVGAFAPLMAGARVIPVPTMNARGVALACQSRALTLVTALVPATVYDLVHDDSIDSGMLSTLRYAGTGAAGLVEELRAAFESKFGIVLRGSYGMTEAPGPVAIEELDESHESGCSGTALPHVRITADCDGQLVVGPAASGPFRGLFRPPLGRWADDGLQSWPDDVALRTGDHGFVAPTGSVHVTSRRTGVIVRGGVNVDVGELESVLGEIRGVRGVAVVSEPDDRLGERIIAFVELRANVAVDPEVLRVEARSLLSHGKVPDDFVVVDALPRNAMGKVERTRLRSLPRHHGREAPFST